MNLRSYLNPLGKSVKQTFNACAQLAAVALSCPRDVEAGVLFACGITSLAFATTAYHAHKTSKKLNLCEAIARESQNLRAAMKDRLDL